MIKKNIKKITIITLSLFCFIGTCYASSGFSIIYGNLGEGGSSNDGPPNNTITLDTNEENTIYSCYFEYSISRGNSVTIYGYNQKNKEIIDKVVKPNESIPSGTSIGLNITETVGVKWGVDKVTLTKTKTTEGYKKYKCKPEIPCPTSPGGAELMSYNITPLKPVIDVCYANYFEYYDYKINDTCIEITVPSNTIITNVTSGEKYNECLSKAETNVKEKARGYLGPSYNINLRDGNSGKALENSNGLIDIKSNITGSNEKCVIPNDTPNTYGSNKQEIKCDYVYLAKNVCMNKITSKVTYRGETGCTQDEIKVPNDIVDGVEHWHYFIPLDNNTNDDGFSISMVYTSQSGKRSKEYCNALIDNNSNYLEFIKDASHCKLTGNKYNDKLIVDGIKKTCEGTSDAEPGCYLGTDINMPVIQKFYGEQKKSGYTTLKGYGMYFRQIDINNPFPNGIDSNSIWYGLYDENTKKVIIGNNQKELSSFDNITYIAEITNQNADKIRRFNNKYSYTNWVADYDSENGMKENGYSNFISKQGVITRKATSFYKLGCGPLNKDWSGCS